MTKELWMNIPVKDLKKAMDFYTAVGFTFNEKSPGFSPVTAPMTVGAKATTIMLFQEDAFKATCQNAVSDTAKGTEVMFSFDAESKAEVDEVADKVTRAGGKLFAPPADFQGWMYGCAFTDPDGHRWNVLHMDMSKMQG